MIVLADIRLTSSTPVFYGMRAGLSCDHGPKGIANLGQTMLGQLLPAPLQLPRPGHRSVASFGHEVSHFDLVVFRDLAFDVIQRDLLVLQRKQVLQLSLISSMSNGLP